MADERGIVLGDYPHDSRINLDLRVAKGRVLLAQHVVHANWRRRGNSSVQARDEPAFKKSSMTRPIQSIWGNLKQDAQTATF